MTIFKKALIVSLAFAMSIGTGVLAFGNSKEIKNAEASEVLTVPELVNDFYSVSESLRQSWIMSSDPANGKSTDYSVYSTSINNSLDGFSHNNVFSIDEQTANRAIQVSTPNSTNKFYAEYIPFHVSVNVPAYSSTTFNFTCSLNTNRSASGGGADYSIELFSFGETRQTPTAWFYHQEDFTTSTGRGYSKYRLAGGTRNANLSQTGITFSETLSNATGSTVAKQIYLGFFSYVESSNAASGTYTGKVTITNFSRDVTYAVAAVNDVNYYTASTALSAYNSQSGSVMTLANDISFDSAINISSAGGRINLNGHVWNMGTAHIAFQADTDIYGINNSGSKITSSSNYAVLSINGAYTVTLNSTMTIESTYSNLDSGRAILLGAANAKLFVGQYVTISSVKNGVQIDDGYLYLQGAINQGSGRNAIRVGTSTTANKYIYLYGSYAKATKISVGNTSKTYIYASYNSTPYGGSQSVNIEYDTLPSINGTVVRSVNDNNYSKFSISSSEYSLSRNGSNLVLIYRPFSVTYSLNNCTQSGGTSTASKQSNLSFTLVPNEDCQLPNAITVEIGGSTKTQGEEYTYNNSTGAVVIYKEYISGSIVVTANAIQYVTIRFCDVDGNEVADSLYVVRNTNITFPYPTIHPDYYSSCVWWTEPDLSGNGFYPGSSTYANESKTYYANFTQTSEDHVDQFVGIQLHFDVDIIDINDKRDTGLCRGNSGYYQVAKTAYNSLLNSEKQKFCTESKYKDARDRFEAWANANGEHLNVSTYSIVKATNKTDSMKQNSNTALLVTVSCLLAGISLAAFFLARKRRFHK